MPRCGRVCAVKHSSVDTNVILRYLVHDDRQVGADAVLGKGYEIVIRRG